MTKMKTTHIIIPLLTCLTSGCVSHISIKDEPRKNVRFSSPKAAQTFYDAYLSADSPKRSLSLGIFVPLPYRHQTVSTDNVRFNSVVQKVDSNHDGVISDKEARAFAAQGQTR